MTEAFKYTAASERRAGIHTTDFHDYGYWSYFCFFVLKDFRSWWSKLILLVIDVLFCLFIFIAALEPESTYKNIQQRKENISFTLKTARSPHLKHNRQDYSGQQKMPGPALMG